MNMHLWIGFVLASVVMGLIPGPGVLSIVGYAISSGTRTALASVAGMAVGNFLAMTLSLAGVGALLAASATAFTILKWAGALYLIGLGALALWRSRAEPVGDTTVETRPISPRLAFLSNVAVGIFHPKTIVFFVAFAPQFIDMRFSYWSQAAILIATFTIVVGMTDGIYALAASRAREFLAAPKARLWAKRAGGGALILSGTVTALSRN